MPRMPSGEAEVRTPALATLAESKAFTTRCAGCALGGPQTQTAARSRWWSGWTAAACCAGTRSGSGRDVPKGL
eukprot:scaffold13405_cov57-Phaeocystis_antarctica.AAC.2